jgi:uncharacterized protein YjbJ (UPF0337 family)
MNEDTLRGNWMQFKGKVKQQWGRLTNDDLDIIDGRMQQLIGKLEERYGMAREEAEKQCRRFFEMQEKEEREQRRAA